VAITIPGRVTSGLGAATNTIALQKPFVRQYFPEIDICKIGTINLALDWALDVRIPDIVTPPIAWHGSGGDERFGITKVELEVFERRHEAWLYVAEYSPHRFNYRLAEVVARPIGGIVLGLQCVLHISRYVPLVVI
jgi:hypothetical protein